MAMAVAAYGGAGTRRRSGPGAGPALSGASTGGCGRIGASPPGGCGSGSGTGGSAECR